MLALDVAGNLAAGVSTSGYPWKYPGRVSTARSVLFHLAGAGDPARACAAAPAETADLLDEFRSPLQCECLAFLDVRVTSVAMPLAELGSAATDALIARIDQGEAGDVMIREPMRLVLRESVAGPAPDRSR